MNKLLKNKVCIITGAGKGFGHNLAISFLAQGAKLALVTRTKSDIENLHESLKKLQNSSHFFIIHGDVTDSKVNENLVKRAIAEYGKIDVLINNAGMRFRKSFLDIDQADFELVMNNNFMSMVNLCKLVIPYMINQKSGKIVNLSSIAGVNALPDLSAYSCSKAAVNGLTKSLAIEFAKDNIQVNAIAAGFSKTSFFEKFHSNKELYDYTIQNIPMKRWGEVKEIVDVCLFLASHMSNYMTGEILKVDGGWSA